MKNSIFHSIVSFRGFTKINKNNNEYPNLIPCNSQHHGKKNTMQHSCATKNNMNSTRPRGAIILIIINSKRYVIEPKGSMGYPNRSNACELYTYRHE